MENLAGESFLTSALSSDETDDDYRPGKLISSDDESFLHSGQEFEEQSDLNSDEDDCSSSSSECIWTSRGEIPELSPEV